MALATALTSVAGAVHGEHKIHDGCATFWDLQGLPKWRGDTPSWQQSEARIRFATSGPQFGINYAGTGYTQRRRQAKWDQGSDKARLKPFPKL